VLALIIHPLNPPPPAFSNRFPDEKRFGLDGGSLDNSLANPDEHQFDLPGLLLVILEAKSSRVDSSETAINPRFLVAAAVL